MLDFVSNNMLQSKVNKSLIFKTLASLGYGFQASNHR